MVKLNKKAQQEYEQSKDMGWAFAADNGYAILMVRYRYETMEPRTSKMFKTITKAGKVFYNKDEFDRLEKKHG